MDVAKNLLTLQPVCADNRTLHAGRQAAVRAIHFGVRGNV